MKYSIAVAGLSTMILLGCGGSDNEASLKKANEDLIAQVRELSSNNAKLKQALEDAQNTPARFLAKVTTEVGKNDLEAAKTALSKFQSKFPQQSTELSKAKTLVADLEKSIEQKRLQEERLKLLGFKAIKDDLSATFAGKTLKLGNPTFSNTVAADAHDDEWLEFKAQRGSKLLSAPLTVSSDDLSQSIVPIYLYRIEGGALEKDDAFNIRFASWESYGTFIGLYHDSHNDFKFSKNVRFKIVYQVDEDSLKKPLAIVAGPEACIELETGLIGQPTIGYKLGDTQSCSVQPPQQITLDQLKSGETKFKVLRIINRAKL